LSRVQNDFYSKSIVRVVARNSCSPEEFEEWENQDNGRRFIQEEVFQGGEDAKNGELPKCVMSNFEHLAHLHSLLSCEYYRYDNNKSSESVGYREYKTQPASCQNPGTKLCLHAHGGENP
jgi:hypothetical protein